MVELPVLVRRLDGKEEVLKVFTYLVDAKILFFVSIRELHFSCNSRLPQRNCIFASTKYVNTFKTSSLPSNLLTSTGSSTIFVLMCCLPGPNLIPCLQSQLFKSSTPTPP